MLIKIIVVLLACVIIAGIVYLAVIDARRSAIINQIKEEEIARAKQREAQEKKPAKGKAKTKKV